MTERNHTADSTESSGAPVSRRGVLRWGTAAALGAAAGSIPAGAHPNEDDVDELTRIWTEVLSRLPDNWGRWGDDDELGTLNYLDGEQAFRGLRAAMRGDGRDLQVFTLQLPYTGRVIDSDRSGSVGDPVFPTRQPARSDNVVDARHYEAGVADPLPGGMKFADDAFITRLFLQGSTQYDALSHVWYDRVVDFDADERRPLLYNGYPAATTATETTYDEPITGIRPEDPLSGGGNTDPFDVESLDCEPITETWGSEKGDILHAAEHGSVGRGVLLDVGRYKTDAAPYRLAPDECVTLSDLKNTAAAQGVKLRKRDILLVRTGSIERARDPNADHVWGTGGPEDLNEPGLCFSQDLIEWLQAMEIPIVAGDNLAVEKLTTASVSVAEDLNADIRRRVDFGGRETLDIVNPLHPALITNLGMTVAEIYWFKDLADACARDGVYDFLYSGSPLKIEHGAGAPINPTVIKATL